VLLCRCKPFLSLVDADLSDQTFSTVTSLAIQTLCGSISTHSPMQVNQKTSPLTSSRVRIIFLSKEISVMQMRFTIPYYCFSTLPIFPFILIISPRLILFWPILKPTTTGIFCSRAIIAK